MWVIKVTLVAEITEHLSPFLTLPLHTYNILTVNFTVG